MLAQASAVGWNRRANEPKTVKGVICRRQSAENADEATIQDRPEEMPAFLVFDFIVHVVSELSCPLTGTHVPGYPQEIMRRLHSFRAAKVPLRYIVGRAMGEQFVVDMCALMREL